MLIVLCLPGPAGAQGEAPEPVDLEDCRITAGPGYPGIKARCGILLRPLDPSDPDSPHIDLNVAVVPALSLEPEPDALVPIAGGPGQASSDFYAAYAGAFEEIRRTRDIVLIDQRGTGDSAPLECAIDDNLVAADMTPKKTLELTRRCLDSLPHDPRFFTTSVAVTDLEALRRALGYTQWNLYGVSYGSRVAQHYARRYPDRTRSLILDGVVPPQHVLGPDIAIEAQRALDSIFARCEEDAACRERFPGLAAAFEEFYQALGERPVEVELPHPRTGHTTTVTMGRPEVAGAVRLLSYHANTIALLPLLIRNAVDGNLVPLAAQFLLTTDELNEQLAIGMHNAVVCTEDVPYIDEDAVDREALEDSYIGAVMVETLETICSIWPAGVRDQDLDQPLAIDEPVLLLSGDADPITPPKYAEQAAAELRNKAHIVGRGQGHGMASRGCVPDIMARFVRTASVAGLDAMCHDWQFAMPFFLDFSGPAP